MVPFTLFLGSGFPYTATNPYSKMVTGLLRFTGFGRLFLTDASVKGMFDNFLDLLRSSSKSASAELAALTAAAELAYNKVKGCFFKG